MCLSAPPLEHPFHEEGHHGKDEQPGVLRQEGEDLAGSFEDIAHDRPDEPGQEGAQLFANSLETISYSFRASLKSVCRSQGKSAEHNANGQGNSLKSPAVLLEDVLYPFPKWKLLFFTLHIFIDSFQGTLILFNFFLCSFALRGTSVFVFQHTLVFSKSLFKSGFLLFQFFKWFCHFDAKFIDLPFNVSISKLDVVDFDL